ncbi:hypothetical protein MLOOGBEN_22200 [Bacillus sp. EB106-08-02-XG196]|uniref:2Fe-2S iron-sulfur cluster-binding protein n=1 Tax=Bacillus sp. EB106-08-02-XG196 TaxID=2737049 RepID=UPI0015C4515E|nr:2Fe-2S iron-sulfur cluster-binding protein [Bacillus sp. EB106-08-02-XG196]NWQ43414.1 hypothetical protein [Bacillus sp. EB106-08-02-XG196]
METITLTIKRNAENKTWDETFCVDIDSGRSTILEALQQIKQDVDPTLAIRYGCRYKHCGLCGISVNGTARMACMTKVKTGMTIGPLEKMPILQDLMVDRSFVTETIKEKKLFHQPLTGTTPSAINENYLTVSKCTDCLSCVSGSSIYYHDNRNEVAAPLFFVKLAQLQLHPLNQDDYQSKAHELGVKAYENSPPIPCPYGIPIKKIAIDLFL